MATAMVLDDLVLESIAERIGRHNPSVTRIVTERDGDHVTVWTVVDDFSSSDRRTIYDAEAAVTERHPELMFDFHVLGPEGRAESLPSNAIYRR